MTDTNGLNDKSFNHLGNLGRLKAQKELGIQTKVYVSASEADYLPNAVAAAQAGSGAVVMNGFLLSDATSTAAKQFPNIKWAITDFPREALTDVPANSYGLTFKSEQSGFLVGYLAAQMAKAKIGPFGKTNGKLVVGAVGGKKIPSVDNWIAGYRAGAKAVDKRFKVLIDYSGDFPNSVAPKCKELALKHISQGSQAEFQVAGGCGLGALQAARQQKVWGIGVDADQAYLGSHILTSGVKRVDTAVYDFYQARQGREAWCRPQPRLRPEEQGSGRRQDQPARSRRVHHQDERPEGAHHQGQGQASGDALARRGQVPRGGA